MMSTKQLWERLKTEKSVILDFSKSVYTEAQVTDFFQKFKQRLSKAKSRDVVWTSANRDLILHYNLNQKQITVKLQERVDSFAYLDMLFKTSDEKTLEIEE